MPEHIHKSLSQFLTALHEQSTKNQEIAGVFKESLDKKTFGHIKGYRKYKSKLIVYVDSSTWSYQIYLSQPKIVEKLRALDKGIKTLTIKIHNK